MNKGCPFCKGTHLSTLIFKKTVFVECNDCGSWGPRIEINNVFGMDSTIPQATELAWERWNKRHNE